MVTGPSKEVLRRSLRRARRALPTARRVREQASTCTALWAYLAPRTTCLVSYAAFGGELDLHDLHQRWWTDGRHLLLPRVIDRREGRMSWHRVDGPGGLRPGAYGIPEPYPDKHPAAAIPDDAWLLIPGLGFDADGARLGQGGGYFDRLLADLPATARTIGVAFSCQLRHDLPAESHDRPVHALIVGGEWVRAPE